MLRRLTAKAKRYLLGTDAMARDTSPTVDEADAIGDSAYNAGVRSHSLAPPCSGAVSCRSDGSSQNSIHREISSAGPGGTIITLDSYLDWCEGVIQDAVQTNWSEANDVIDSIYRGRSAPPIASSPSRKGAPQRQQVFKSLLDIPESDQQLLFVLEQCCEETEAAKQNDLSCGTSTTAEDGSASSINAGGRSDHLHDDEGVDRDISDDTGSKLAYSQAKIPHLPAELRHLPLATLIGIKSILVSSAKRLKYWVHEANVARAELSRLSSQLATSVPIRSVLDGSAECVKAWVEKADAARVELSRLSSRLAASVPIKSVLSGSATCVRPWVHKVNDSQAELTRLSSQLALSVPIKSVLDGSAKCVRPWVEKAGAVDLHLVLLQDQIARIQRLEAEKNQLQSILDFKEKTLKRTDEEVRYLRAQLVGEQDKSRQTEVLREQAPFDAAVCVEESQLTAKLAEANKTVNRLSAENMSLRQSNANLQQSNADLRKNYSQLKQLLQSAGHSDQFGVASLRETQSKLQNANETIKKLNGQIQSLQQRNADLRKNYNQLKQSSKGTESEFLSAIKTTWKTDQRIQSLQQSNADLRKNYNQLKQLLRSAGHSDQFA